MISIVFDLVGRAYYESNWTPKLDGLPGTYVSFVPLSLSSPPPSLSLSPGQEVTDASDDRSPLPAPTEALP